MTGIAMLDELTLKVDRDFNGSYDTTELVEDFNTTSGYETDTLTHDAAGNTTYDGVQKYAYDAWNRLVKVAHAYRDAGGTLQSGSTWVTMAYDGRGRRITKAVTGTGSLDCTYHYYYDRDSLIETRNGSDELLKQHAWGLLYIDELCQITVDGDPGDNVSPAPPDQVRWAMQDANFNVLGVVDESGVLAERYEYSPYGQRTAFFSAGANDVGAYSPAYIGRRAVLEQGGGQPYAVCDVGHQGLVHDEESGLVYNRARALNAAIGRFAQRDSFEYVDGMNSYQYLRSSPISTVDPTGAIVVTPGSREDNWGPTDMAGAFWQNTGGQLIYRRGTKLVNAVVAAPIMKTVYALADNDGQQALDKWSKDKGCCTTCHSHPHHQAMELLPEIKQPVGFTGYYLGGMLGQSNVKIRTFCRPVCQVVNEDGKSVHISANCRRYFEIRDVWDVGGKPGDNPIENAVGKTGVGIEMILEWTDDKRFSISRTCEAQ
jgi:RHS repeat-associated protein